ncbi:MAG: beta-galactosidase family protein [Victivallaceae bacterium]|nr:beta-galactosidase family protein [Victivallaceae bacterium]
MPEVRIADRSFIIDGRPVKIHSGAIHYFRVHPEQWEDRIDKAAAMGLNCIETYVPWNLHEPHPGEFDFSGGIDLARFLTAIADRGLYTILRPGPYICAEWDNGGFPAWLTARKDVEIRRTNPSYCKLLERYLCKVLGHIPSKNSIIIVQVENEYGSCCGDVAHLEYLRDFYRAHGVTMPLYVCGGSTSNVSINVDTAVEGCFYAANFGSRTDQNIDAAGLRRPDDPAFCMEFWDGWFDHWGEPHHVRSAADATAELENMLKRGVNFNLYMFHGGTNFGFTNGANDEPWSATITSYDYDSPLSECGDPTDKFESFQKLLAKHAGSPTRIAPVAPSSKLVIPPVEFMQSTPLTANFDILGIPVKAVTPLTLDELGENFGFVHYRTELPVPFENSQLRLDEVHDFTQAWLDGEYLGSRMRGKDNPQFMVSHPAGKKAVLDLLVENCGRINFGPRVGRDPKGIVGGVLLDGQLRWNWECRAMPMNNISKLKFSEFMDVPCAFHRAIFKLDKVADTFVVRPGRHGIVWINGFNLGRYRDCGPQRTLYVPAPVLRKGINEIVVFEQEQLDGESIRFADRPDLG